MHKIKVLGFISILIIIFASFLTGCGEPEATTTPPTTQPTTTAPTTTAPTTTAPRYGGIAIFCQSSSVGVFGLPWEFGGGVSYLYSPCIDTLIDQDGSGNLYPRLATDWTISPDNLSITFNLRDDVWFHDGTKFNAQAVKYNWDLLWEAERHGSSAWESIDVIDDYTIRLNLQQWSVAIFSNLASPDAGGGFISPSAIEEEGLEYLRYHPVGTGPFIVTEVNRESSIKYVKNENYWQEGRPYLDGLEWKIIPDAMTMALALRSGEVDMLNWPRGSQIELKSDLSKEGYTLAEWISAGLYKLTPDSANPDSPLADIKVRMAIEYAIDKETIAETLGLGVVTPVYQIATPGSMGYDANLESEYREFNPEKAIQLLEEAGFDNGELELNIYAQAGQYEELAEVIQAYCRDVGVILNVVVLDTSAETEKRYNGWTNGYFMNSIGANPNQINNFNFHFDPNYADFVSMARTSEMNEALMKALESVETDEQTEYCKAFVRAVFEDAICIPLFTQIGDIVYNQEVLHDTGFQAGHIGWFNAVGIWKSE